MPFFEYLPFTKLSSGYFPGAKNYIAGTKAVPFQYKEHTIAPLICYEALFTGLVKAYIEEGADIIINPGNDGWFGEQGALGHLSLAMLRTIEYRIPLIRVNNSGVSTVINHKGEVLFDTLSPLNLTTGKVFSIKLPKPKPSFFFQYGSILNICSALFLILSIITIHRKNLRSV